MRRGEVWWANLPKPAGRRPVLLLSRNAAYRVRTSVTVAPLSRTIRSIPSEVKLGREDGFREKCVVNLDNVITIPKSILKEQITTLSSDRMEMVQEAIAFSLDLSL